MTEKTMHELKKRWIILLTSKTEPLAIPMKTITLANANLIA
jgi:hypothetical protein